MGIGSGIQRLLLLFSQLLYCSKLSSISLSDRNLDGTGWDLGTDDRPFLISHVCDRSECCNDRSIRRGVDGEFGIEGNPCTENFGTIKGPDSISRQSFLLGFQCMAYSRS